MLKNKNIRIIKRLTHTYKIKMNNMENDNLNSISAELTASSGATSTTYRKPTSPSGAPLSAISPKLFPLPLSDSFKHYWDRKTLEAAQHELLSTLPFYPESSADHSSKVLRYESPNSLVFPDINEFHIKPKRNVKNDKHLVFIHGYGAGLGFFIKNIEKISKEHPDWHIHAIDLPGYGCSTRVTFPSRIPFQNYETVEKLFTVPLRDWFVSRGLDEKNTVVVAHSMGGYLSLALQLHEVQGTNYIGESEYENIKSRFSVFGSKKAKELNTKHENQMKELTNTSANPRRFWNTLILVSPGGIWSKRTPSIAEESTPTWFVKLWNQNISPFSVVRNLGPLGSYLVSGWTSRRFAIDHLFDNSLKKLMHQYSYTIFNAKGSGEYMLNYLLAAGAVPRHPMFDRLEKLKSYSGKTVWMYGTHDWMDYTGGIKSAEKLNQISHGSSTVELVPDAGHHIYLDAFDKFNELVGKEMNGFEKVLSKK
ncbi:unnamed protein product [Pichia kudriavzevii]|uniref:AB hydrolase-1 domain-containing protein n=1 Tax=Pichia kudriavzevii TaxID=4909 RepID=A0A099P594_PICKU|nr:hypothetical protein JL09_g1662 [Pichia kudriavzevii]